MSTVPSIPSTATNGAVKADASAGTVKTVPMGSNQTLTQADFLKIMVAQFTQQDPLASGGSGGSNSGTSDYVNELMSMTNLTTMQTMSSQEAIQIAGTLPGSTVQLSVNGAAVTGTVQNASISNGSLYLTVNGEQYPATSLVAVTQTAAQAAASSTPVPATPVTPPSN